MSQRLWTAAECAAFCPPACQVLVHAHRSVRMLAFASVRPCFCGHRAHASTPPSAVLIDWTGGAPRPKTRDHAKYAHRARAALDSLLAMPLGQLRELRAGVARAARDVVYTRALAEAGAAEGTPGGAVDVIVESMRSLRRTADAEEARAYEAQLRDRQRMIEAQEAFESTQRRAGGGRRRGHAGHP